MSYRSMTLLRFCSPIVIQARHGHRMRGKAPDVAKSLKERLAPVILDEEVAKRHDIGFPYEKPPRSAEFNKRFDHLKKQRSDFNLEKAARAAKLEINLDEVKVDWFKTAGPFHIRKIAEHYGIYDDLFGKYAYFVPRVFLDIKFPINEDTFYPVYSGNKVQPAQAKSVPEVTFDHKFALSYSQKPEENTLWTLVLTNPDGHLTKENSEYVHWMVSNIPNNDISKGDQIVPYLQPIPPKGTGHHRYIFVLYKQDKKLDLSSMKVTDLKDLEKRTFSTFDFYKKHEDSITPSGLAFFQAKWDESVRDVFHKEFNMKQPIFEYDFPKAYLNYQKQFPLKQPFNLYLDRYADPKDVNKRYLEERLAKTHPFDGPEKELQFPNAHELRKHIPSWKKTEIRKERLGRGRINDAV
ncbi:large ribosomal subunit protein mL38 [Chironomus tepperi]|uniref:large ribosomal subunit protein mL38 n=1 Tax=Chironomus tepperi TaxID=113505 RepID=UPI00391FB9CE